MAIVLKLKDILDFTYVKPEKAIVLTTKTLIYEIVVDDEEHAKQLIKYLEHAIIRVEEAKKETKFPKFYKPDA